MILGFKEKVKSNSKVKDGHYRKDKPYRETGFVQKILNGIKIHTLRDDNDRWRKGMVINFATGTRTKDYNEFMRSYCTGTQSVELHVWVHRYPETLYGATVLIDGRTLTNNEVADFVRNDGFNSMEDFYDWFSPYCTNGEGVHLALIHWTDYRY